jgi:3-oxoacyl-[acyl-carrier-protein] synthase II
VEGNLTHRVAVTGMGMVTCLGSGLEANWEAVTGGRSGIAKITLFDASLFACQIAGEVKDNFDPQKYIPVKEFRRLDRFQQFGLVAAGECIHHAALEYPPANPYRCGVIVGSGIGGLATIERGVEVLRQRGPRHAPPLMITMAVINLCSGLIAIRYGFKGHNTGVVNACSSGTSALGEAFRLVREGRLDVALAGGAEAVVTPLSVAGFGAIRALSTRNDDPTKASRPFDAERDGFVLAEGAGMLLLESFDHARSRGARIYAEIVGYGATDDAFHMVMPDSTGDGAYWAMKLAVEEAGIDPSDIDYINAHGTSTSLNDKIETLAIKRLLGNHAYKVAISSTKSMTGHLIGAAGAVEAIYSIMTINKGLIPPTINLENPDPECDLDYTPNKAARKNVEVAISNSFAFGGQNACLVFKGVA